MGLCEEERNTDSKKNGDGTKLDMGEIDNKSL